LESLNIGRDLLIVLVTALAGGMLARFLRLPVILGYLVGGIVIGPYGIGTIEAFGGTGFVHNTENIDNLATLGVVLLLFTIGLEFSIKEIMRMGKVVLFGGIAQILLTAAAGFGLGKLVGLSTQGAVFFGFIISLSSTMVVLKILMERGELDTTHGRIMLGILLVQDISVVPIMVVMSALGGEPGELWGALGIAVAKAMGFIALMLVLGVWGMPWFLRKVAGQRSRELFLLTVVVVCLTAAFGTFYFGLSAAFGAFAAGLLISQSGFARQAFADILPLRDTFGALFFVSLGMLANLHFIGENIGTIVVVVVVIILGKFVICSAITRIFGYGHKTVLMVGTGLIQIGEFSFIIAMMGVDLGILSERLYSLTVAAAIITMLLTPFAMSLNSFIYRRMSQQAWFARHLMGRVDPDMQVQALELSRHAVICGYGAVGKRIAEVLEKQKFSYLVIDLDPTVISQLRAQGIPCIYGDASNSEILAHTSLDKARVLICTIPDYVAEELTARNALRVNPKLDIVARVHRDSDVELLKGVGVNEIVLPFFEGSLEMIRHTLHRFGMSSTEIQYILNTLRESQVKRPEQE
jgi:CPA2 family monovalent cation:H+ antiporter-2